MDEIVRQAMAKWPNVPHCRGWLALDARGAFRMRDEAAQAANAAGDVIRHPALLSFIYRNYSHDEHGAWYFQNGPQRVYVELAATPYIARTAPMGGFVTHDGEPLPPVDAAWITDEGRLVLEAGGKIAMVDDRDLAECVGMLRMDGTPVDDEVLMIWLERMQGELQLDTGTRQVPVRPLQSGELSARLGFIAHPARQAAGSHASADSASPSSPAS
jgi:hypothetical protein